MKLWIFHLNLSLLKWVFPLRQSVKYNCMSDIYPQPKTCKSWLLNLPLESLLKWVFLTLRESVKYNCMSNIHPQPKICKSWHLNLPLESLSPQMGILDSQKMHWQQCPPIQSKLCFTNWSRTKSEDKYWGPQHTLISSKAAFEHLSQQLSKIGILAPTLQICCIII
jgi:hypothetical protein